MTSFRIFTVESGRVSEGAEIGTLHLKGADVDVPAILIGEEGRGRLRGVLPVGNPPMIACPDQGKKLWTSGEKCPKCGAALGLQDEFYREHPDSGVVVDKLLFAEVGQTKTGKPKLFAKNAADSDAKAVVVFLTKIGFRGGNSHSGDRSEEMVPCEHASEIGRTWEQSDGTCPQCGVRAEWVFYKDHPELEESAKRLGYGDERGTFWHIQTQVRKKEWLPFPGEIITEGRIAQGDAGGMGSGQQLVAMMPKGVVFRTSYSGRLYGAPSAHYYVFNGEKILSATWDERTASDLF